MASIESADYAGRDLEDFRAGYATGARLVAMHVKGMLTKRVIQTWRNITMYLLLVRANGWLSYLRLFIYSKAF